MKIFLQHWYFGIWLAYLFVAFVFLAYLAVWAIRNEHTPEQQRARYAPLKAGVSEKMPEDSLLPEAKRTGREECLT